MSFVYGTGLPLAIETVSPNIDAAAAFSRTCIDSNFFLTFFLPQLSTTDFSLPDDRKQLLRTLLTPPLAPQLTNTGTFDPIQYPLLPPYVQTRFPSPGVWYNLNATPFLSPVSDLRRALSYREGDPDYPVYSTLFEQARLNILTLSTDLNAQINRFSFETRFLLVWSVWPNPETP